MPTPPTKISLADHARFLRDLMRCPGLTRSAMIVGERLVSGYRADWRCCCYRVADLAEMCGITTRAVIKAIQELEERRFIAVDRSTWKNKYTPLIGYAATDDSEPEQELPPAKNTPARPPKHAESERKFTKDTCTEERRVRDAEVGDGVNAHSQHSIEGTSYSYRSTCTPKTDSRIKDKPIACRGARQASELTSFGSEGPHSWTEFREAVLRQRMPPGWDKWGLVRSVDAFVHRMCQDNPRWVGAALAMSRLKGWMRRERYRTENDYIYRGFNEWVEHGGGEMYA